MDFNRKKINSTFIGSANIIIVICSNCNWLTFITNSTINHHKFKSFLLNLNKWLKIVNSLDVMSIY